MLNSYYSLFLYFFIFSVIGYIVEVANVSFIEKKLVLNRGFLIGPYLPIYGVGSVIMTFFLAKYEKDVIALFVMGLIICSVLEFFTSLILEKIFKVRWWDYSDKKFNIDGRICLENGFLFGLGGVAIVKIINPILNMAYVNTTTIVIKVLAIICSLIFYLDLIVSVYVMSKLKITSSRFAKKDATSEIKEEIKKSLYKDNKLLTRLLKSFPDIKPKKKEYADFTKLVFKVRDEINKIKQDNKLAKLKRELKEEKIKLKQIKKHKNKEL